MNSDVSGSSVVSCASTTSFSVMLPNSSISPMEIKMLETTGREFDSSIVLLWLDSSTVSDSGFSLSSIDDKVSSPSHAVI